MHTRRLGAFLIGAWLLGSLLMAFVPSQALLNVDRFFSNPPSQLAKELDDMGTEVMRQILRFQAVQHNRHILETWEIVQLGLGGALLATSFLTAHRSRIVLSCSIAMFLMALTMYFYLTPVLNALGRSVDFIPAGAAMQERESFYQYTVWYRVLDILKALLGMIVTARLLFDRYDWQDKLIPGVMAPSGKSVRKRRRQPSNPSSAHSEHVTGEAPPVDKSPSPPERD
ncbi:MAG TPA: hypothetical protein VEX68_12270 [Bryobacteraceae bacterium]|nr:hypothetical protein [Bryobacteraceae bacterium]